MIVSYFQTTDNSEAQKFLNKENIYLDLCSSVIPFTKREKGSLIFALINQKQISKVVVPNISVLGRNQISSSAFSVSSDWLERLEGLDRLERLARDRVRLLDGGMFSLSKPFFTRRRRKFIHMDSNLVVSIALSIPVCTLYVKQLLTQAEKNFKCVVKNTLLSVSTCFRSFHFAYAEATR